VQKGKLIELALVTEGNKQFTADKPKRRDLERQAWSLAGNYQIDEEERLQDESTAAQSPVQSFLVDVFDNRDTRRRSSTLHLVFYLT
jgi:hypothetical protein